MSEHWNATLHPPDTAGGKKLAELCALADASGHGSAAHADYAQAMRDAYTARGFRADARSEAPPPLPGHPDGGVGEPAPKHAAPASHAPAHRRSR